MAQSGGVREEKWLELCQPAKSRKQLGELAGISGAAGGGVGGRWGGRWEGAPTLMPCFQSSQHSGGAAGVSGGWRGVMVFVQRLFKYELWSLTSCWSPSQQEGGEGAGLQLGACACRTVSFPLVYLSIYLSFISSPWTPVKRLVLSSLLSVLLLVVVLNSSPHHTDYFYGKIKSGWIDEWMNE